LKPFFIIFCLAILTVSNTIAADSTINVSRKVSLNLSGSFTNSVNWNSNSTNDYYFNSVIDYHLSKNSNSAQKILLVKYEIGYIKIEDSLLVKYADALNGQLLLKKNHQQISQSKSLVLSTQLFDSYNYSFNILTGKTDRQWKGTLFNPLDLDVGYGIAISFWSDGLLNIALATTRVRVKQDYLFNRTLKEDKIATLRHGYIVVDYGLSAQLNCNRKFLESFEWNCSGKFFANGFNRQKAEFDIRQKLVYKIWKCFHVKGDVNVVYAPLVTTKMQLRSELVMGLFYINEKK
jgi:hypothetical protein